MTAKTSENLAQALAACGLSELEKRARADEFHDFLSPHAMPASMLVELLYDAAAGSPDVLRQQQILNLRGLVMNGEFDATEEEADAWAASEDGQETFRRFYKGEK